MGRIVESSKTISELQERVRRAREEAHLSQKELGDFIGVSDKSVSAYEQGRSTPPFEKLRKIATFTNRPITFFTEEEPNASVIVNKLTIIEKEMAEIRALLRKSN